MGQFFYAPTLPIPIFEQNYLQGAPEKFDKNWVLIHKKSFLCYTQSLTIFPKLPIENFLTKIGMVNIRGITKDGPNLQVYDQTPATPTTPSYTPHQKRANLNYFPKGIQLHSNFSLGNLVHFLSGGLAMKSGLQASEVGGDPSLLNMR